MKQIPIIFSTPMIQAILDGRKTQTRRLNGLKLINEHPGLFRFIELAIHPDGSYGAILESMYDGEQYGIRCPYGKPGDVLWVRESFYIHEDSVQGPYDYSEGEEVKYPPHAMINNTRRCVDYKAQYPKSGLKWKSPIHMPKSACRIWLEVVSVKVERLQEITRSDAIAEGLEREWDGSYYCESFKSLWQSIHGKDSWELNPFVWVIEFRKIDKP